ncbi:MAG: SDR family oxidoreductase [Bacteroidetes bacterium]|nr:MAG: SDR family oxidoreductase [Bacteroidota bacterium]
MKRVLVTGSNGLLGQKLTSLYTQVKDIELIATGKGPDRYPYKKDYTYASLDITNEQDVMELISRYKPDTIIHTAAMTNVDQCETEKEACRKLNVDAVSYLIHAANANGSHLIHLSTDFIFDGTSGPYAEDDEAKPLSYYGWSKLDAENLVKEKANSWAIVRTILVFGIVADMSRSNIVLWAKGALESGKELNVVDDQFRSATLAEDLAMGCRLIEQKQAQGIYHISGKDYMSVFELVSRVAAFWNLPTDNLNRSTSAGINQAAQRPPKTGFILDKAVHDLAYNPHSFEEGLAVLDAQLKGDLTL